MSNFSFKKGERLKRKKLIEQLFQKGASYAVFPLRMIWTPVEKPISSYPLLFSLTVSKKKFPKATDRNRIKRIIREAYRLHKHKVYETFRDRGLQQQYACMIIYTGHKILDYKTVEKAMIQLLQNLVPRIRAAQEKSANQ